MVPTPGDTSGSDWCTRTAGNPRETRPAVADAPGAAAHSVRLGVLLALTGGDEDLDRLADEPLVLLPGDSLLQRDEPLVAFLDDLLRHLVIHRRRGRARSDGVLEGERRGEPRGFDDAERVLEVVFGLTREADDDVGGN